jgi:hypothetical protein
VRRNSPPGRVGVPDRRRRYPHPLQDAADRGRSHAVTELDQLALDSLVSPVVILSGHALDQRGHRVIDGRTSDAMGRRPLLGDQAMMPAQDRARCDQAMLPQHLRQPADEGSEDRAIHPVQARLRVGSAQHDDFMAQHQELDVLGHRRATEQQQQVQQPEEDKVRADATTRRTIMPYHPSPPISQVSGAGRLLEPRRCAPTVDHESARDPLVAYWPVTGCRSADWRRCATRPLSSDPWGLAASLGASGGRGVRVLVPQPLSAPPVGAVLGWGAVASSSGGGLQS